MVLEFMNKLKNIQRSKQLILVWFGFCFVLGGTDSCGTAKGIHQG